MGYTMLVDANNLYYRAWHGAQGRDMTADGVSTATLVLFMATLSRLVRDWTPTKLSVVWDGGKSRYRTALRSEYKATRDHSDEGPELWETQLLVRTLLVLMGVQQDACDGFEADDVIAGYWHMSDTPVRIVSNDKDLTQLCGGNPQQQWCDVLRLSSSNTESVLWGAKEVKEHFGCWPTEVPLLLALMGDKADNIEGIYGIGPKKAIKIMEESGFNVVKVLEHPKVKDHAELIKDNLMLTNLRAPLPGMNLKPLGDFKPVLPGHQDWRELEYFLKKYKLTTILTKLRERTYWKSSPRVFGVH